MINKITIDDLVRNNIKELLPYSTARDEAGESYSIYLDANENPNNNGYNRYPDPRQKDLKNLLSRIKGVSPKNIFLGNGSDEAIDLLYRIFCNPASDNVVAIAPTYGMYRVAAMVNDIEYREVQLNNDFSLDVSKILSQVDKHTKLIFLCSPNNPTGNSFTNEDIVFLINNFWGIVVVDEAYIDFSANISLVGLIEKYDNLIILQTLSKAYGLAGLRIGLAISCDNIIGYFNKVKYPYNINVESQRRAIEVVKAGVKKQIEEITEQRALLMGELLNLSVVKKVWTSEANFLLVKFDNPSQVYSDLIYNGIVVRNRSGVMGCKGCLRITVGTPQENIQVLNVLKNYK